jgi:murein DD-endopeptidase MepM/ murein hydrolase activator NlpD
MVVPSPMVPRGPTPTRAPLSVTLPVRASRFGVTTPTPDFPHSLPLPREYGEQYTIQSGDTLFTIAQQYGVPLEVLMQANGLNEASVLSVGSVVNIPPVEASSIPGSSFKIIPDSELVYGPASVNFDMDAFVNSMGGYLASHAEEVNGEYLTGSQIVSLVAKNYSVNPRLLLALLEYQSGWVSNSLPSNVDFPLGYYHDYYSGLYRQLTWAADSLSRGYYLWRVNGISTLPLSDNTSVPLDPTVNAGTMGVQYFFSLLSDRATWDADVGPSGLFQTYVQFFGYPFDFEIASLIPPNLIQPPMQLPFEPGVIWAFTGGPHGGWDAGSAWGALDFAPPLEGIGCAPSDLWVTAVANGPIIRAENGAVVQDLDNDGYEQTGWTVLYMHVDSNDRIQPGSYAYAGDRIGHPSCDGGISNATHLHLARRYNGEWIAADGNLPFNLDGWISSGNGIYYDGFLTRNGVTLQAEEGVFDGVNLISR